jgi:hypothetical protein
MFQNGHDEIKNAAFQQGSAAFFLPGLSHGQFTKEK